MNTNSWIATDSHITITFSDGETANVNADESNFGAVCNAVKAGNWDLAKELAIPMVAVRKVIDGVDEVVYEGGVIKFNDEPLHLTLTERMVDMIEQGFDVTPMARFLVNLKQNPSYRAVNELYGFMEKSKLPITEDGYLLAYKRVDKDLKDSYTHTLDNSPGSTVKVPRNEVDEDPNETCSHGLHFCSREYLPHYGAYGANRVIMVKVNPRDVVAVPTDYNNAKVRCCEYYVVKELDIDDDSYGRVPEEKLETSYMETPTQAIAMCNPITHETIDIYDSIEEAAQDNALDVGYIRRVLRGERKTTGGYHWKYTSDSLQQPIDADDAAREEDDDNDDSWDLLFGK